MSRLTQPLLLLILLTSVVLAGPSMALGADEDAIVGTWLTAEAEDGRAHVQIVKDGDSYRGTIVWLELPTYPEDDPGGMPGQTRIDRENPDPDLRDRPILGLEIVSGFEPTGDGRWGNGTIYDPANGKTYKCKAKLSDPDTLKVRGFIGVSLLGRTEVWTRVDAP